jgi:hypothetical protein
MVAEVGIPDETAWTPKSTLLTAEALVEQVTVACELKLSEALAASPVATVATPTAARFI